MSDKRKRNGKTLIIVCLLFVAVLSLLASPLFSVDVITVTGNARFTESEILDIAGVKRGENIFLAEYRDAETRLLENTYIKFAEVTTTFPDKMDIEIVERKTCGYVPFMGTYLYIDQDGYVLENAATADGDCPIVTGLKFQSFSIAEQLETENKNSFDIVMLMSKLLINYDFIDSVKEMNISDPNDIRLFVDNIDISFGGIEDADKKVRTAIEIIKSIPEGDKGVLHLENPRETPYFTYTS